MTGPDVCVVGEINLDLILYGLPEELKLERELLVHDAKLTLGSSSAIFAHNLSVLGTRVGIVSKVGTDPLGKIALDRLSEAGVDIRHVSSGVTPTSTGLTVILAGPDGRYILTYPGMMFEMSYADLDLDYIFSARHLHLASFFLHRALRPRIADLFREAKAKGLSTSLDTNDDPEDAWGVDLFEVLPHVDVLFVNEREAKRIARTENLDDAVLRMGTLSKSAVIKMGPLGAVMQKAGNSRRCAAPAVDPVDTVGAGDSFDAGFIHRFLEGGNDAECLEYASAAGALSATRAGGTEAFRDREGVARFFRERVR